MKKFDDASHEPLIKLVIVSHYADDTDQILQLIEEVNSFRPVGQFLNAEEALQGCKNLAVDVILIDRNIDAIKGTNSIELLKALIDARQPTGYVLMSMSDEPWWLFECRKVGVSHCLSKPLDEAQFKTAVRYASEHKI